MRAEVGEAQARAAVDEFLNRVTEDTLLKAPGLQTLRRDLLGSALRFYDEFLEQRGEDPGLRAALAEVHLRVGNIQRDLGDGQEARRSFQAARGLYEALMKLNPADRTFQAGLASCQFLMGEHDVAIAIREKLIEADPTNPRYRRDLSDAYNALAIKQSDEKKVAEPLQTHQKALALREGLVRDFPDSLDYRLELGATLNNLGVLLAKQGHPLDALAMYLRAVEHDEAVFAKAPQNVLCGRYLGTSYLNIARTLHTLHRTEESERWFRKTIGHWQRMNRDNPSVPAFRASLYQSSYAFGRFLLEQDRIAESAEPFRLATRAMEELPRRTPGDLYNLACVQARAAAAIGEGVANPPAEPKAERQRLIEAAMDSLRRSIEGGGESAEHIRTDEDLEILRSRSDFQALAARKQEDEEAAALARRGESDSHEEKLKAQQEALAARAKLVKEDPQSRRHRADLAASQHSIGQILADLGQLVEAEKTLKDALKVRETLAGEEPKNVRYRLDIGWTLMALSMVHWKAMRLDQVDREWTTTLRGMETAVQDEPEDSTFRDELPSAWIQVAEKLLLLGLWEEADELLQRAFQRNPASLAFIDGYFLYVHALLRHRAGDAAGFRAASPNSSRDSRTSTTSSTCTGPAGWDRMHWTT